MTSFIPKLPLPVFYPTYNMLSCRCTRAGVSKLVYLSEVVGKAEKVPMQRDGAAQTDNALHLNDSSSWTRKIHYFSSWVPHPNATGTSWWNDVVLRQVRDLHMWVLLFHDATKIALLPFWLSLSSEERPIFTHMHSFIVKVERVWKVVLFPRRHSPLRLKWNRRSVG